MGKYKQTIDHRYQVYIQKFPEYSPFSIENLDYPFQEYVLGNTSNLAAYNISDLERNCLVELRDDIPSIRELPMDDLAWVPVGASRILKIQRLPDHDEMWKLAGDMLVEFSDSETIPEPLVQNTITTIRAVLGSDWRSHPHDTEDWSQQTNQRYTLQEASVLARYMAFPTVEGLIKSFCQRDIKMSGEVRPGRRVLKYPEHKSNYLGDDGDVVNHLGHLLWHLEQDVAETPLQERMIEFREAIYDFYRLDESEDTDGVYGYFSNQRNTALHGEAKARSESGILLNLIALLIFNIDHIPEHRRTPP